MKSMIGLKVFRVRVPGLAFFNNCASIASSRITNCFPRQGPGQAEQYGEEERKYDEKEGVRSPVERSMSFPISQREMDMNNNIVDSNEVIFLGRPRRLSG